jgi:hypothetical protein
VNATRPREVPLEAGLGPDNPPCPACGEPLFGWEALPGAGTPVRRCERCGLGVAGPPAGREEALAAAGAGPLPNRASFQARLGGSGWAGLEPGRRFLFTVESLRLLGLPGGRPRPHLAGAWQTILNSFTFGHNVALGRLGRAVAVPAGRRWQRVADAMVSVLAAPVVLLGAGLLEGVAGVCGAGGRLPAPQVRGASSPSAAARSTAPPT